MTDLYKSTVKYITYHNRLVQLFTTAQRNTVHVNCPCWN